MTFLPTGPFLVPAEFVDDPSELRIQLRHNGQVRQDESTKDMIFDIPRLIEYASSFYTLYPGDVLITGTPEGVSPIQPGDVISAYVEHIGTMEVKVRAA